MADLVAKLDDWGRPAWLALMVLGFIVFWPIGLGILAYLIWSGRMGCGRHMRGDVGRWQAKMAERFERKRERWGMQGRMFQSTGNAAFDEYREETLHRLEEEAREFQAYLERLRMAKDRAEFDQFMTERRGGAAANPPDRAPDAPSAT